MPKPIKRRELIHRFRNLGWSGPVPGGKHAHMFKGSIQVSIPNPHRGDLDWSLVKQIIAQARVSPEEWERAGR